MPSSTPQRNLTLAAHFLNIERPERAVEFLAKVTVAERETVRYWSLLAEVYYQQEQFEQMRQAALDGLGEYPEDVGLLRQLASAYRHLEDCVSAERTLRQALDQQPDNATLHFDLAYTALQAKAYDAADGWLSSGSALTPESTNVAKLPALIAYGRKEWESAETLTNAWLQQDPQNSKAYHLKSAILSGQGRRQQEAKEALERAAQLDATSSAATNLRRMEQRQSGCLGIVMLFCVVVYLLMSVLGVVAYLQEDSLIGLVMALLSIPFAAMMAWFYIGSRRAVMLRANELVIGRGGKSHTIPYNEIVELRNGQLGIRIFTARQRYRLYRFNRVEQTDLFVKLRSRVPETFERLVTRIEQPLPLTIGGNWRTHLAMLALLACGLVLLYGIYYDFVIAGSRSWAAHIIIGLNAVFVALLALWRMTETPIWLRFSAETILIRYLFKARRYDAAQLEHVALRRGYRIFKGRQMPNHKIELHFADGELLSLDESEVPHPAEDWSPLYELASRLQTQYDVSAPPHQVGQIGRYLV